MGRYDFIKRRDHRGPPAKLSKHAGPWTPRHLGGVLDKAGSYPRDWRLRVCGQEPWLFPPRMGQVLLQHVQSASRKNSSLQRESVWGGGRICPSCHATEGFQCGGLRSSLHESLCQAAGIKVGARRARGFGRFSLGCLWDSPSRHGKGCWYGGRRARGAAYAKGSRAKGPADTCDRRRSREEEERQAWPTWSRRESQVTRAFGSCSCQDGRCKGPSTWSQEGSRRARGGGEVQALFKSRLFSLRVWRGVPAGSGSAGSSREPEGTGRACYKEARQEEESEGGRGAVGRIFFRGPAEEEEEEEETGRGYKRFYYSQLADPVGFESQRDGRGEERQGARREKDEAEEESWLPACQDPYQLGGWTRSFASKRGWPELSALWEEGEETKEGEKGTEKEEGGRSPQQFPWEFAERDLRRELQRGLGGGVFGERCQAPRGTVETQVEGETRVGLSHALGSRAVQTGPICQGHSGLQHPEHHDQGHQDVELLCDRGEEPNWEFHGPSQGTPSPGAGHRPIATGGFGRDGGCIGIPIHFHSPVGDRRVMDNSPSFGNDALRRGHSSGARDHLECAKTGPACSKTFPRRQLGMDARSKRTRRRKGQRPPLAGLWARRQRSRQEGQQRKGQNKGLARTREGRRDEDEGEGAGKIKRRRVEAPALATAGLPLSSNEKPTVELGVESLKEAIRECRSFVKTGVVLAWWLISGHNASFVDGIAAEFMRPWLQKFAKHKSSRTKRRGVTFPLRLGELQELEQIFADFSLADLAVESVANLWGSKAWAYLTMGALNRLAGYDARLMPGRWSAAERAAFDSIVAAARRRCAVDSEELQPEEEKWRKGINSKRVGYNGEELSTCHELTLEQVLPALPPAEHGGCINSLDWVGPRTQEFLCNPKLLLKKHDEIVLPKLPGRVHIREDDKMNIAFELVRRNVCTWIPLEKVYKVNGTAVLNGMFGVSKPTVLADGRPILRVIMNLTGSNATQLQLEGGCNSLPNICAWQSIVLDGEEQLTLHQSDMCSAFYLFRIPMQWHRYLAFNIVAKGTEIGLGDDHLFALACSVIPMGWLNSVGIMQEISERLLSISHLSVEHRISRGASLPPWMNSILDHARDTDKHWWHVYLDNFAGGERIMPTDSGVSAILCHTAAEKAWASAGVVSSDKKRMASVKRVTELGAEVDGELGTLGVSTSKLLQVVHGTLWMVSQRFLDKKLVQIMAGRWVFILQFRRPAMSCLQKTWDFIGGKSPMGDHLRELVKAEFLSLVFLSPLLHCNLRATICPHLVCTDASERGGSVDVSSDLTDIGHDFVQACEKLDRSRGQTVCPILLVSLFNGIGGCFRCYDLVGINPLARIAVELDEAANRVTLHCWPGTVLIKDVKDVTREVVRSWSMKYLGVEEVHLWGGWPCVDLSSVKHKRQNLAGPQSSLFWEIPRIRKLLEEEFGSHVIVKHVLENVASMDESAAREISGYMESLPYKLDSADAVPMRRPRFTWTSETLESVLPDVTVCNQRYWKEVTAAAEYPLTEQWLTPGYSWKGEQWGAIFPTCLKSIPRDRPPPRPAGLDKADEGTKQRWRSDNFRYPPYQYDEKFLITSDHSWRLLNATEKELLLGYGYNHTSVAWSAGKAKQNPVGFSDCRHKLLGDSFSCFSFVVLAVACCQRFLPQVTYQHLSNRMGMAPGFCSHLRSVAPLQRKLCYGSGSRDSHRLELGVTMMNRLLLRRTNHTGSDVRVVSGEVFNNKAFPRHSVAASWWTWSKGYTTTWKQRSHINVLELETLLLGVKFQIQRFKAHDMRIFQLTDSYICMSVASKGRSSSKQLQRVLNKLSAHLLAYGLQLVVAHVDSRENPSDAGSRAKET